jgi:hypothetical protein
MRTSVAFFAGVGTVIVAVAAGLGGGLTIANLMSPQVPKQQLSKVERRGAGETSASSNDPLMPVPYMAATQASANGPIVISTAAQNAEAARGGIADSSTQGAAPASEGPPSGTTASADPARTAEPVKSSAAQLVEASQPSDGLKSADTSRSSEPTAAKSSASAVQSALVRDQPASFSAYAKARPVDVKQVERRRADRHQQWADRRRYQPSREQELRDVEAKVREATETRDDIARPTRIDYPQVRFFEAE